MMDIVFDYIKELYYIIRYIVEGFKLIWYNLDNFID